jgi:tetratricopeptide (TPR) repeat protein
MIIDADGSEHDWILGYDPPPDKFEAALQKSLNGENAYKTLAAAYAKDPKDVGVVFGLARKYGQRYDDGNRAKSADKYKEVIALDPEGKAGTYTDEEAGCTVPFTVYAEYSIAWQNTAGPKPDMEPVRAFIRKYPDCPLVETAYRQMGYYYGQQAPQEESTKFFADYTAKYPNDARAADMWLARIIKDKVPLEQGQVLVDKIKTLTRDNPVPDMNQDVAQFYILKGDKAKAEEAYGPEFMDGRVSGFAADLASYAAFWIDRKAHEDSALAMAELAHTLQPDSAYILRQLTTAYLKTDKEDKALAVFGPDYLKGIAADGNALNGYASYWLGQGKNLESALEASKKTVALRPNTGYYWSTLSDVYLKMKNYPEALKAAEKAVELTEAPYQARMKQKIEAIKKAQAEEKK